MWLSHLPVESIELVYRAHVLPFATFFKARILRIAVDCDLILLSSQIWPSSVGIVVAFVIARPGVHVSDTSICDLHLTLVVDPTTHVATGRC